MCTLYTLIGSGVVKAITAILPINRKEDHFFDGLANFTVEFENDIPTAVLISIQELDLIGTRLSGHPYFEPLSVETRLYNPNIDSLCKFCANKN